jgi:hypothetical protein
LLSTVCSPGIKSSAPGLRRLDESYLDTSSSVAAAMLEVNRRRFQRLMSIAGIEGLYPKTT